MKTTQSQVAEAYGSTSLKPVTAFLRPEIAGQHKARIAHAETHAPDTGHAPFWEDSSAFNQRLRAFVEMCSAAAMARPAIASLASYQSFSR